MTTEENTWGLPRERIPWGPTIDPTRCRGSGECARKTMELAGFRDFQYLKLGTMGFKKGETRVTAARIREVAAKGAELLEC